MRNVYFPCGSVVQKRVLQYMDALEIGKRNSIQHALNDYFTEWYLFSVKQLNVSNRFISLSHFTLSFSISFSSFDRISVLVKLSVLLSYDLRTWV